MWFARLLVLAVFALVAAGCSSVVSSSRGSECTAEQRVLSSFPSTRTSRCRDDRYVIVCRHQDGSCWRVGR